MLDSTTKQCRTCGMEYPATSEHFPKANKTKDGLRIHCRTCLDRPTKRQSLPLDLQIEGVVGIQLTRGYVAIVDVTDADLAYHCWKANVINGRAYASRGISINGKESMEYLHRLIYERIIDRKLSRHELVDHWDNDPTNNRRDNLRLADYSKNGANRKMNSHNTSEYKGTAFKEGSWYAVIRARGVNHSVGGFKSEEEAHAKYREMAQELFGEYARFE